MRTIYVFPEFPLNRWMRKDIRRGKPQVVRMRGESSPLGGGDKKILGFIYLAPQTRNLGIFRGAKKSDRIGRILWHNFTHSVS